MYRPDACTHEDKQSGLKERAKCSKSPDRPVQLAQGGVLIVGRKYDVVVQAESIDVGELEKCVLHSHWTLQ